MSKVVYHLGGWGMNYGDRVLQVATSDILRNAYQGDLQFVYIDNQKTYWSSHLIDKMNSEADLLLIGGGGFIMHRPEDKSRSGWQFNIKTENIDRIKIPMVAYGIGYNKFPHDTHDFPREMWDNLQRVIDKCSLFSVRNSGTYLAIQSHGIDMKKVEVVPDAGMFIKSSKYSCDALNNNKLKIGINWATDRPEQRFASSADANYKMEFFLNVVNEIAKEQDAVVYLIDHLLREERNYRTKDWLHECARKIFGDRVFVMYDEVFEDLFPPFDYLAPFFADIYRQMDFVMGMRGHSNIISFGQNTPCIGLGQHNKVKWFLEHTSLGELAIALNDEPAKIYTHMRQVVEDVILNLDQYKEQMLVDLGVQKCIKDNFASKIAGLL